MDPGPALPPPPTCAPGPSTAVPVACGSTAPNSSLNTVLERSIAVSFRPSARPGPPATSCIGP
eukprot:8783005-Lingulodinium_polyedra.AAC.1